MYIRLKHIVIAVVAIAVAGVGVLAVIFRPWEMLVGLHPQTQPDTHMVANNIDDEGNGEEVNESQTHENQPRFSYNELAMVDSTGEARGNTTGNHANMGIAVQSGDWVFFSTLVRIPDVDNPGLLFESRLHKAHIDGGKAEVILTVANATISNVNAIDGWLYFVMFPGGIHRVRFDGTSLELINDEGLEPTQIAVVGEWIYFNNIIHHMGRMRRDGSNKERLGEDFASNFVVADGWIYYIGVGAVLRWELYKMRTDGTDRTRLSESDVSGSLTVHAGWVYFINRDSPTPNAIYKMRTDGTDVQMVVGDDAEILNIFDGWVFYANFGSDIPGSLYRIRLNSTQRERISEYQAGGLAVVDGWLFNSNEMRPYGSVDGSFARGVTRMRHDGTEREVFQ